MALPALAAFAPALFKGFGEALPYLTLGLFKKNKIAPEQAELLKQQAQVEQLRRALIGLSLTRQRGIEPLFGALAQGAFNMLPKHMTEGREFKYETKPPLEPGERRAQRRLP